MSNGSTGTKNTAKEEHQRRQRWPHDPAMKVQVLRKLLKDQVPISTLCAEYDLQAMLVYTWLNALNGNLKVAVDLKALPKTSCREGELEQRIKYLEGRVAKKNEVIAVISQEYVQQKKRAWGAMTGVWVPNHVRDELVDFIRRLAAMTELSVGGFTDWLGIARGNFFAWQERYGQENRHNGSVPRDFWPEDWERAAILDYHDRFPLESYSRLAYMMLDANIVAVSPSSVYRMLRAAGVLDRQTVGHSLKGTGFVQPERPHAHRHIDIAYLNVAGTFYYFCAVLDGYSRFIVHWEIRESMVDAEIEVILQRARERFPEARLRIISDNGPQFIAREFKQFIRLVGMTQVRTSPTYPQSNGKNEAFHKTLKTTTNRPKAPGSLDEAQRVVGRFVDHYNQVRLHSSLGYVAPADQLAGRADGAANQRPYVLVAGGGGPRKSTTRSSRPGEHRQWGWSGMTVSCYAASTRVAFVLNQNTERARAGFPAPGYSSLLQTSGGQQ